MLALGGIAAGYALIVINFFLLAKGVLGNPMAVGAGFVVFVIFVTSIAIVSVVRYRKG
jgi:hypothetical protein